MKRAVFLSFLMIGTLAQIGQAAQIDVDEKHDHHPKHLKKQLKLEMVVELSRHGERASKGNYPKLVNGKSFEVAAKELTKKGAESHYAVGKALREEFKKEGLIDTEKYNPLDVYVQSTMKQRTISSANA